MGQTGKRNIFDELTNKLSNVSIPDTSTGIDFDTFKNNALNKIKGSDLSNMLKSDNLLSSDLSATDMFNSFSNKIAGTVDVDFKELADSIGAKALPSDSSLDADFFKQAVDKMKSVSIKEGMVIDDQEAMQKFNELNDKLQDVSIPTDFGGFNEMINSNEGTVGVDYIGDGFKKMQTALTDLASESSDVNKANEEKFPRKNPLHDYAPYNYIVTLSCLNIDEFQNNNSNGVIVAKGGGAGGKSFDGLDYYVDNLVLRNSVAPTEAAGTSSVYQIQFQIVEPYGVKFIDTLRKVAKAQGYANHMGAVYNLKIEFKGVDDDLKPTSIPNTTRNIPISIYTVDMNVEAGVTTYAIQAAPAHYTGLQNIYDFVSEDINAYGNTVGEIVNSFFERYTEVQRRRQKDGKVIQPDEYELDAAGSEDILTSPVGYDENSAPHRTKNISILASDGPPGERQTGRKVTIAKGSSIVDVLTKIVVESEYYRNKFDDNNNLVQKDGDGFTTSLRIFTKLQILSPDNGSGRQAVKLKYYLRTQRVSAQHLNYKSNEDLVSDVKASRTYDYLYTGKNQDVLDFNINYKFAYYQKVPYFDAEGNIILNDKLSAKSNGTSSDASASETNTTGDTADTAVVSERDSYTSIIPDAEAKGLGMATIFDQILQNPAGDLLVCQLDILGDPYWIEQKSVLTNNMAGKSEGGSNTYIDGSVLPDDTEVFIRLNFKVPSDIDDEKGLFKIDSAAFFKGIYKVFICESRFEGGMFTQNLSMYRMRAKRKVEPFNDEGVSHEGQKINSSLTNDNLIITQDIPPDFTKDGEDFLTTKQTNIVPDNVKPDLQYGDEGVNFNFRTKSIEYTEPNVNEVLSRDTSSNVTIMDKLPIKKSNHPMAKTDVIEKFKNNEQLKKKVINNNAMKYRGVPQ